MRALAVSVLDSDGQVELLCNAIGLERGEENVFEDDEKVIVYNNARVVLE